MRNLRKIYIHNNRRKGPTNVGEEEANGVKRGESPLRGWRAHLYVQFVSIVSPCLCVHILSFSSYFHFTFLPFSTLLFPNQPNTWKKRKKKRSQMPKEKSKGLIIGQWRRCNLKLKGKGNIKRFVFGRKQMLLCYSLLQCFVIFFLRIISKR